MPLLPALLTDLYRWLAGLDLSWAQELCIYMFIWMAKFGAAYGVRTGIHVGVDVFVNMLAPASRKRVIVFGLLCGALFTGIVAIFGGAFVWQMFQTGTRSNDLEVPMWIVYSGDPARLRPDVLPLPAGRLVVLLDRAAAAPRRRPRRGRRGRQSPSRSRSPVEQPRQDDSRARSALILILVPLLIVAICFAHASRPHRAAAGPARARSCSRC